MASLLPMVISGAAGVALAASLWQIGTRVRPLESQRAAPSPLTGLTSLPGGTRDSVRLVVVPTQVPRTPGSPKLPHKKTARSGAVLPVPPPPP
jgi:hypothetical protein